MAAVTCGSAGSPDHGCVQNATRSRPTFAPTSDRYGRSGAAITNGSPGAGPLRQSSSAAVSRTLRLTMKCTAHPDSASAICGPQVTRPRDGLRPTTPHAEAGIRIEPPPSLAEATGTIPAPTTAAAPPLDPPAMCWSLHGEQVRPTARVSVVPMIPNSDVVVRPRFTRPAARIRAVNSLSVGVTQPWVSRLPFSQTVPASPWKRSLSIVGTPPNGPGGTVSDISSTRSANASTTAPSVPSTLRDRRQHARAELARGDVLAGQHLGEGGGVVLARTRPGPRRSW